MSTSVTVSTDLKDYLSARSGDKSSLTSNISNLFNANKAKQWFYRPLSTEESNDGINGDINGDIDDNSRWPLIPHPFARSLSICYCLSCCSSHFQRWVEILTTLKSLSGDRRLKVGFLHFHFHPTLSHSPTVGYHLWYWIFFANR